MEGRGSHREVTYEDNRLLECNTQ